MTIGLGASGPGQVLILANLYHAKEQMSDDPSAVPPSVSNHGESVVVYNVATNASSGSTVDHVVVYGHSNLFYWWPVWLVSFVLAWITYAGGSEPGLPGEAIRGNGPGGVFVITLLAVAVSSTVIFRGMLSVLSAVAVVALAVSFAWFGWWDEIFHYLGGLDIRINTAGYLCVGVPLFVIWTIVMIFYDRQHYVIFGRGQIRYVQEVGDSEMVIPSGGATVEKRRSDGFRHWVLGLGAGDLVIRVGGNSGPTIEMNNVLWIRRKMTVIDKLLREKSVLVS